MGPQTKVTQNGCESFDHNGSLTPLVGVLLHLLHRIIVRSLSFPLRSASVTYDLFLFYSAIKKYFLDLIEG